MAEYLLTREVQITNTELGTIDVHRQVYFATSAKVLDAMGELAILFLGKSCARYSGENSLAIPAMLWSSRDGSRALFSDFGLQFLIGASGMHADRLWWQGHISLQLVCGYELGLSLVPGGQDFWRRRTSQNSRMDQAGKLNVGNMSGRTKDSLKIPDRFGTVRCC